MFKQASQEYTSVLMLNKVLCMFFRTSRPPYLRSRPFLCAIAPPVFILLLRLPFARWIRDTPWFADRCQLSPSFISLISWRSSDRSLASKTHGCYQGQKIVSHLMIVSEICVPYFTGCSWKVSRRMATGQTPSTRFQNTSARTFFKCIDGTTSQNAPYTL